MQKVTHTALNVFVILLAVAFLFPLYWMILTSFKHASVTIKMPPELWPKEVTFANYQSLWEKTKIARWFWNSLFVSASTAALVCITSALAGYAFAKKQFAGKRLLFILVIGSMMIPRELLLVPLFEMMRTFHWFNSYPALIFPLIGWPLGVFMLKQFCSTIPGELIEAAHMDGSSAWGTFGKIVVPLIMPGIGALAIFTFISTWNDYLWQLVMINSDRMKTLQVGIASLQSQFVTQYGLVMAGAVVASLPMIVVFIFFQRYFTEGITLGAIKG